MGFKEDADFTRFLTIGAYGTAAVKADLEQRGHHIIELERYSMANKVWRIKVKRLRITDLLCVECGLRIESRAKSKLEIKLSDSATPGREWYAGGMRDRDVFAFIRVDMRDSAPVSGPPQYLAKADLAAAAAFARQGGRKSVAQGSEIDISWPSWVPSYAGRLVAIDELGKIYVRTGSDVRRSYDTSRWPSQAHLYLEPGDEFGTKDTVVAGVVAAADVGCPGTQWDIARDLRADDPGDRYAAVKATRYQAAPHASALAKLAGDMTEDWRIRLEAAASLATLDPGLWVERFAEVATDVHTRADQQMEAVLILASCPVTWQSWHSRSQRKRTWSATMSCVLPLSGG